MTTTAHPSARSPYNNATVLPQSPPRPTPGGFRTMCVREVGYPRANLLQASYVKRRSIRGVLVPPPTLLMSPARERAVSVGGSADPPTPTPLPHSSLLSLWRTEPHYAGSVALLRRLRLRGTAACLRLVRLRLTQAGRDLRIPSRFGLPLGRPGSETPYTGEMPPYPPRGCGL